MNLEMNEHVKIKDEALALIVDAFEANEEEQATVLSNKIVTVRKPRPCDFCKRPIDVGERARVINAVFDGEHVSNTFCSDCLNEMIDIENGDIKAVDRLSERMYYES